MIRLILILSVCFTAGAQTSVAENFKPVKHLIDTHIHFYDTTRDIEMAWPPKDDKVLYKPHLPAEYSKLAKASGVTGVVVVEASDHLEDNRWILDLVEGDDFYMGLVGNIDVYREGFRSSIKEIEKRSQIRWHSSTRT
jgi:L-fuconolactonase